MTEAELSLNETGRQWLWGAGRRMAAMARKTRLLTLNSPSTNCGLRICGVSPTTEGDKFPPDAFPMLPSSGSNT